MDHNSPHGGTVADHTNGPRWLGCVDQLVGGAIEKIRREMSGDTENRYDHTKQLVFKRSDAQ